MDFLRMHSTDFEELFFDMNDLKTAFENREETYTSSVTTKRKGVFDIRTERRGNIYYTVSRSGFDQDTLIKSEGGIQNISLYFVKSGHVHSVEGKTNRNIHLPTNTNNIFFMQEDLNESSVIKKNVLLETHSLHLTTDYFEKLVELYPDIFEESYSRFKKGESFYINNECNFTTPQISHILSQIENANVIGNCIVPYVDAKVLELLCLQFQNNEISLLSEVTKDEEKIREASYILVSDIHNPPSIRDLSLQVGINEKKLKQGFKSVFKTTVYGYLFEYKMNLAQQLLQDTQQTIAEIALHCGYNYPSHFCTAFKRKFGTSPLEMKKAM